jgi:hypothetical protein
MSLQVLLTGRFDGFMVLAMLWAAVNAIPPLLFIVYFFTKGWLLRWSCFLGQMLGLLLGAGDVVRMLLLQLPIYMHAELLIASTKRFWRQDMARELVVWFLAGIAMVCIVASCTNADLTVISGITWPVLS